MGSVYDNTIDHSKKNSPSRIKNNAKDYTIYNNGSQYNPFMVDPRTDGIENTKYNMQQQQQQQQQHTNSSISYSYSVSVSGGGGGHNHGGMSPTMTVGTTTSGNYWSNNNNSNSHRLNKNREAFKFESMQDPSVLLDFKNDDYRKTFHERGLGNRFGGSGNTEDTLQQSQAMIKQTPTYYNNNNQSMSQKINVSNYYGRR